MASFFYYLGPYVWGESDLGSCYQLPPNCEAGVDLRLGGELLPGVPSEKGFFAAVAPLDSAYHCLGRGDIRDVSLTSRERDLWKSIFRRDPIGDTLAAVLFDHMTNGADPAGWEQCRPLMPTAGGVLELQLHGHGPLAQSAFRAGHHAHWPKVQACLQRHFRGHFESDQHAAGKVDQYRMVLDMWCEKYRLPQAQWQVFVPDDLRKHAKGPLPHATEYTDDFNRPDSDSLGINWTEIEGNFRISSNSLLADGTAVAQYTQSLSSDDHYAAVKLANFTATRDSGIFTRMPAGSYDSGYLFQSRRADNRLRIYRRSSGTWGAIAELAYTAETGATLRGVSDGSSHTLYYNGTALIGPLSDSVVSGNVKCGLRTAETSGHLLDDFAIGDISITPPTRFTQLERGSRGMFRGIYRGGV
jgi:hypothetical protein